MRRRYSKYDLPLTVVKIVEATCEDYPRRKKLLRAGNLSDEVRDEYTRLNGMIEAVIAELDEGVRVQMLSDIGKGVGYGGSTLSMIMSKIYYYRVKRAAVRAMAERMRLI